MVIRAAQMQVLAEATTLEFEHRILDHLKSFAPKHCAVLQEDDLRSVIRYGWHKANDYGFFAERSVRIYIQLMLMIGAGFDSDPQIPWAWEMLTSNPNEVESARIDPLHERAWDYADAISKDYETDGRLDFSRFVDQISTLRQQSTTGLDPSQIPGFRAAAVSRLKLLFASKSAYIGDAALDRLFDFTIQCANSYRMNSERGVLLFFVMMFVLGSGFHDDPQLPWVSAILNDKESGPNDRVDRLLREAVAFLTRWWELSR
jgi:hypothetical protein